MPRNQLSPAAALALANAVMNDSYSHWCCCRSGVFWSGPAPAGLLTTPLNAMPPNSLKYTGLPYCTDKALSAAGRSTAGAKVSPGEMRLAYQPASTSA